MMRRKDSKNTVICKLVGEDGNAYAIMGRWHQAARRAGWNTLEIEEVLSEARSGDYEHLLATIAKNCQEPNDDEIED